MNDQNWNVQDEAFQPAPKKPFKWWIVAVAVAAVAVLTAAGILLYSFLFSPEARFASAVQKTGQALSQRFDGSPLEVLSSVDTEKAFKTQLELALIADVQTVSADLTVRSDPALKRYLMSAAISNGFKNSSESTLDIGLYADTEALAAYFKGINEDKYFGLEYTSFREDLMKSPLASVARDNPELVDGLEELLQMMHDAMQHAADYDAIVQPYADIFTQMLSELELSVGEEILPANKGGYACEIFSYRIGSREIIDLSKAIFAQLEQDEALKELYFSLVKYSGASDADAQEAWESALDSFRKDVEDIEASINGGIDIVFYVYEGSIVTVKCNAKYETAIKGTTTVNMIVDLGKDAARDDLTITIQSPNFGVKNDTIALRSHVDPDAESYTHRLELDLLDDQDRPVNLTLNTVWDPEADKLQLSGTAKYTGTDYIPDLGGYGVRPVDIVKNEEFDLELTLKQAENGFTLSCKESIPYGDLFGDYYSENLGIELSIGIHQEEKGVETPQYDSLENWSQELADLLTALGNSIPYRVSLG